MRPGPAPDGRRGETPKRLAPRAKRPRPLRGFNGADLAVLMHGLLLSASALAPAEDQRHPNLQ
jgi:hypothetical protein